MITQRRDTLITFVLLVLLVIITLVVGLRDNAASQEMPRLTRYSTNPFGAQALVLWLESLGYDVVDPVLTTFKPPSGVKLAFVLEPVDLTSSEAAELADWVEQGGVLVVTSETYTPQEIYDQFGFSISSYSKVETALPEAPVFRSPVLTSPIKLDGIYGWDRTLYLKSTENNSSYVTILAAEAFPVMAMRRHGRGKVFLSTTSYFLSNRGIREPGSAELILNLLASAEKGKIWFDEWHHGYRTAVVQGPEEWLRASPIGRSLLFIIAVVFFALLLRGWAFGRPVPLPKDIRRRSVMEHIVAIANLNRRAGHRKYVLQDYRRQLKRQLGQRYRLDPSLDDAVYVDQLAQYNPSIDHVALLSLLNRLNSGKASETEMVQLASQAARWMQGR